jgi:cytochrome c-type biogenesis protein CcmE
MLKKLLMAGALMGIPAVAFVASRFGQLESTTFQKALSASERQSQTEQGKKVQIDGVVLADDAHQPQRGNENVIMQFVVRDEAGKEFSVSYVGKEDVRSVQHLQRVAVVGLPMSGNPPVFQASQVIF